jgi:D-alanyl-D-alanine carboxypeptidase
MENNRFPVRRKMAGNFAGRTLPTYLYKQQSGKCAHCWAGRRIQRYKLDGNCRQTTLTKARFFMKQFSKFLIINFLSIFVVFNTYGQMKDDYSAKIDSLIQTTSPRSFNGVVLITQKGKIKYLKATGYSNFEKKIPLTTNDNFRIQSNSKQITAVLVLKEVEKGKIDLQSAIRKYLPDFPQTWADSVTIHQMLNLTSGIIAIDKPLSFKPGTNYLYNNPTYSLLGNILEKVTGKRYIDIANNLFEELEMKNTFCYEPNKNKLINGYVSSNDTFKLSEIQMTEQQWIDFVPAGGIISNLRDLNIWDTKLHNGKIIKPETYQLMSSYTITAQHDAFGNEKIGYGYGLRISDKTPVRYMGHAGKGLGFVSIKFYIPDKDVDVIVLENQYSTDSKLHYYFESKIREIVLDSSLAK